MNYLYNTSPLELFLAVFASGDPENVLQKIENQTKEILGPPGSLSNVEEALPVIREALAEMKRTGDNFNFMKWLVHNGPSNWLSSTQRQEIATKDRWTR